MSSLIDIQTARKHSLSIVEGIRVGHWTDAERATGCTAIVCEHDAIAGVDVRGGATASHEIELLEPTGLVDSIQGIMLSGGSAMGLGCVQGAIEYFREHDRGFRTEQGVVPIVPGASIYDLGIGDPDAYPTNESGMIACQNANSDFDRGSVGAGAGAVVGKIHGHARATRGGLGSAGWETDDGLRVGAIAVVNAFGDVLNPVNSSIIAGAQSEQGKPLDSTDAMIRNDQRISFGSNTTLCVISTNAKLTKTEACIVSRIAQCGISRSVSPCHTQYDGDMVFSLSMGDGLFDLNRIGVLASKMIEAAIVDAVLAAEPFGSVPAAGSLGWAADFNDNDGQD